MDSELLPFLQAEEASSDAALAALLVDRAEPITRRVTSAQLRGQPRAELEDTVATVLARLTRRLRALRDDPEEPIESFSDYVAKASYNACHELMRQLAPRRAALVARLRYLARRGLVLRLEPTANGGWRCLPAPRPASLRGETQRLATAVAAELGQEGRDFDDLIEAVAKRLGEVDEKAEVDALDRVPHPQASPEQRLGETQMLRRLWPEILDLPINQRAALLLNLRQDAGDLGAQLAELGVAEPAELAGLFDVPAEEAASFLARLPREDTWIAQRLGVTRRQVINLRKAARARLARRVASWQ